MKIDIKINVSGVKRCCEVEISDNILVELNNSNEVSAAICNQVDLELDALIDDYIENLNK